MQTIEATATSGTAPEPDASTLAAHPGRAVPVLQSMFDPDAALAAARRLYREHRSGVRFFCENGKTVPIDQIADVDESGESITFGDWAALRGTAWSAV